MTPPSRPPTPPGKPVLGHSLAFADDSLGFIRKTVDSSGDVFRMRLLGRDLYVVADPNLVETVLSNRDAFAKLEDFEVAFGDALLSVEGDQWRRQRHAMEDFFSPTRLREYTETMVDATAGRIDDWSSGASVRIGDEMRAITLQNLFEVVLGHSIADDEIDDLAETASALNLWFKPTSWLLPDWVPTPARREFRRGAAELRSRSRSLLDEAGAAPDDGSLLAKLADRRDDPDSEFDRTEILDQVVGMIFAGHETTALALTYALHQIGSHPDVAEQVYSEIDEVLDGPPTRADLQELTYLENVIDEALRLYPPIHGIPRVTADTVELSGYEIPAGKQVQLAVWSIHRDSRFYDDPLAFDPGRWADASPRDRGYAFVPFGAGPRACIGRHFARLETTAVLATVGRRYRLEAGEDVEVAPQMTSQPDGPVTVHVENRD